MYKKAYKAYLHLVRKIYRAYSEDHRNCCKEKVQLLLFTKGKFYLKFS